MKFRESFLTTLFAVAVLFLFAATDGTKSSGTKLKELPEPSTISWQKCVMIGNTLFDKGSLYNGLNYYTEAVKKNPKRTELYLPIADGNFALRDYKSANNYYKLLAELDGDKPVNYYAWYQYALTNKYIGNYEDAKATFQQLSDVLTGNAEQAELRRNTVRELEGCELGIQLRDSRKLKEYLVEHLDNNINQPFTDYAPVLADPNTLYFGAWVSDEVLLEGKTEKYATFSRIYSAKRNGNTWTKAQEVTGAVDTVRFHTGNATFTGDGKTMYYTQCFQDDKQRMRCSIYRSTWSDEGWAAGERLSVNDSKATTTQPALGKDESGRDVLYFASDRNGKDNMDLFCAVLNKDGSLQEAKALSAVINTGGDEMTPFYDFSSNELYFSSNGHVNIGGLDIYKTTAQNGAWQKPQHLGLPVNSSVDDMYYTWNDVAKTGFFVSNRPGGFGLKSETCCDDIYRFRRNVVYIAVKGTLLDVDSNKAITNQPINLIDAETGEVIKSVVSNGDFFFDLKPDTKYKLSGLREGFFAAVQNFTTEGIAKSDTLSFVLSFQRMVKNKAYTLNNIYYDFDKSDLREDSKAVLDTLFILLQENPSIVIELSSHTDSKGSDKYNLDLSQKRAESCVNYLVSEKGLPKERITAKGYGESTPVAPNTNPDGSDNEAGRAKNRRTEFKIVGEVK
ncbi:MAG: OmpA family protein [Chitinophagales bacterium]|nr:OmpA family protein [Chitinophagales bacterium]